MPAHCLLFCIRKLMENSMAVLNTWSDSASMGLIGYCQAVHWSMIFQYIFMSVTSLAGDQTALRPSVHKGPLI